MNLFSTHIDNKICIIPYSSISASSYSAHLVIVLKIRTIGGLKVRSFECPIFVL